MLNEASVQARREGVLHGGYILVKETAARLGFTDAFHFSRMFKRVHGVAPNVLANRQGS